MNLRPLALFLCEKRGRCQGIYNRKKHFSPTEVTHYGFPVARRLSQESTPQANRYPLESAHALWQDKRGPDIKTCRRQTALRTDRKRVTSEWGAISWAVITQGVSGLTWWINPNVVGQGSDVQEKVRTGSNWLHQESTGVAVPLQLNILEIERLMTEGGCFPCVCLSDPVSLRRSRFRDTTFDWQVP